MKHALEFIFWVTTSPLGRYASSQGGFNPLAQSLADGIVMNISYSTFCRASGEPVFQPRFDSVSQGASISLRVLGAFSGFASSCVCAFLFWLLWAKIGLGEVLFLGCAQAATLSLALVSFAWSVYPPTDMLCTLSPWFAVVPLALLLAAIFGRLLQILLIWKLPSSVTQRWLLLSFVIGAVGCVFLFVVMLLIWTVTNPVTRIFIPLDSIELIFSGACTLESSGVFWVPLFLAVIVFLCAGGISILLVVWKINPVLGESRWLFITLYTTLLGIVVMGLLLYQEAQNAIAYSAGETRALASLEFFF